MFVKYFSFSGTITKSEFLAGIKKITFVYLGACAVGIILYILTGIELVALPVTVGVFVYLFSALTFYLRYFNNRFAEKTQKKKNKVGCLCLL